MRRTLTAVVLATMLVLTAVAPMAVSAQESTDDATDLTLELTQDPETGNATVTLTNNSSAVTDATVIVTSNESYAGNGTYTTDENGTVSLPEPEQPVNVTVTADDGDRTVTTDAQLSPVDTGLAVDVVQNSDGTAVVTVTDDGSAVDNATVNVTADVVYDGNGTYATDENGTVDLPAPEQNVTVTVTAVNGSDEATTTVDLDVVENGGFENFGQWVSSYVHQLQEDGYFGAEFGQKVSEFATGNNPGADNRPDHAGPPDDDADADTDADDGDEDTDADENRGPPEHAGNGGADDENRGPPEHAGNDDEDDEADADADGDADEGEDVDEDDVDCDVEASDESCEDDEDDEDDNDAPGNSGGARQGNGNARGK